jgi:fused signal recognition particle receptor
MFKFFKKKLGDAVSKFSRKAIEEGDTVEEEKPEEEITEEPKEEKKLKKIKKKIKKIHKEEKKKEPEEIIEKPDEEITEEPSEEKKGFMQRLKERVSSVKISEEKFDELFFDFEMALLENNVALKIVEKIKENLKQTLTEKPVEKKKLDSIILNTLKSTIEEVLDFEKIDIIKRAKEKKPYIIAFLGINGSGKTTTIAKVASLLKNKGLTSVIAASDTFRAAAIQQMEEHADKLNIKMIKHEYGSDPAAVAFDAVNYAKAKNIDVVLIDTAGRLHSNKNLMDELKKINRVINPDLKIFIGESITGNDCIEQVSKFDSEIGIDGIILTKADTDEKGGTALSVSYISKKPILFLGTGQNYEDLKDFSKEDIVASLGLQ